MRSNSSTTQVLAVTGEDQIEVCDVPRLAPGPYDAVVQVEMCSICAATDSHIISGEFPRAWLPAYPFYLQGLLDPDVFCSAPMPLAQAPLAFAAIADRSAIKIPLTMPH